MKTIHKMIRSFLVVIMASLMIVGRAQAAESCHKINAKGVGSQVGPGQTVAQIKGGGLLQGTSEASFGPGVPPQDIMGTVKFTTNKATLTVAIAGSFNMATGAFSVDGPVASATGKLAGATGHLAFNGLQDLSTGEFVETITGAICVDLAP